VPTNLGLVDASTNGDTLVESMNLYNDTIKL
jgi:hypothetical protein